MNRTQRSLPRCGTLLLALALHGAPVWAAEPLQIVLLAPPPRPQAQLLALPLLPTAAPPASFRPSRRWRIGAGLFVGALAVSVIAGGIASGRR